MLSLTPQRHTDILRAMSVYCFDPALVAIKRRHSLLGVLFAFLYLTSYCHWSNFSRKGYRRVVDMVFAFSLTGYCALSPYVPYPCALRFDGSLACVLSVCAYAYARRNPLGTWRGLFFHSLCRAMAYYMIMSCFVHPLTMQLNMWAILGFHIVSHVFSYLWHHSALSDYAVAVVVLCFGLWRYEM